MIEECDKNLRLNGENVVKIGKVSGNSSLPTTPGHRRECMYVALSIHFPERG